MASSKKVTKTMRYSFRRVPKTFGKGTKNKFGKTSAEKKIVKTKMPRKVSAEQIISSMGSDAKKVEALKNLERSKSARTALLTTGSNVSQAVGSAAANEYAKNSAKSSLDLTQLVSGGISQTGTSRDDDEEGSPEVM